MGRIPAPKPCMCRISFKQEVHCQAPIWTSSYLSSSKPFVEFCMGPPHPTRAARSSRNDLHVGHPPNTAHFPREGKLSRKRKRNIKSNYIKEKTNNKNTLFLFILSRSFQPLPELNNLLEGTHKTHHSYIYDYDLLQEILSARKLSTH